jgi:PAS domain S-box-containing protein
MFKQQSEKQVYITSITLSLLFTQSIFVLQILFVLQDFQPQYIIAPTVVGVVLGLLIGKIRNLQNALQKHEKIFRAIADKATEFSSFRTLDGEYQYVSPAVTHLTGYDVEDFYAHNNFFDALIYEDDRGKWSGHKHGINESESDDELQVRVVHKEGKLVWINHNCSAIYDGETKIGIRSVNTDITSQKLVEEKQQQLVHQSRLAAMGEMLSMIAHQWRQPLSSINTVAANVELQLTLGEQNQQEIIEALHEITHLTQHLSHTINDFKEFFRPDKVRQECDLQNTIESSLKILTPLIKLNQVNIVKAIESHKLEIFENELKQVLVNLIKNALDALVEHQPNQREIEIRCYAKEQNTYIEVNDNAGGISEEIINKIFDPYFSTKSKNGTGLGLYMSKTIINDHMRGELSVKNGDVGASFTIQLPSQIKGQK